MLKAKKQSQVHAIPYIKPTAEADRIALLKMEREKMERENCELSKSLDEKRNINKLDYDAREEVEKEHFDKISKLQTEYADLTNKFDTKLNEFEQTSKITSRLEKEKQDTISMIKVLDIRKLKLNEEIKSIVSKFNNDNKNKEKVLKELNKKIENGNIEFDKINSKLIKVKEELRITIEKCNKENRVLSIKQKDLSIYEARIRKINPNIIL